MTGMASPEKASSSKKKGERKCATKEEYRQLSSIMGVMNNLRKQVWVCVGERDREHEAKVPGWISLRGLYIRHFLCSDTWLLRVISRVLSVMWPCWFRESTSLPTEWCLLLPATSLASCLPVSLTNTNPRPMAADWGSKSVVSYYILEGSKCRYMLHKWSELYIPVFGF